MRHKRSILLFSLIAIGITLGCCFGKKAEPHIEISVLEYYENGDPQLRNALVMVTNNGPVAVLYNHMDPHEPVIMRTELRGGWVEKVINIEGIAGIRMLLSRGSAVSFKITLPEETLRWQLRYTVRSASNRESVRDKLTGIESGWGEFGGRLYEVSGGLLSTNEGAPRQFWSDVFEFPASK